MMALNAKTENVMMMAPNAETKNATLNVKLKTHGGSELQN